MKIILFALFISSISCDYFEDRNQLLQNEESQYLGHRITLSSDEEKVNEMLMAEKKKELDEAFLHPESFGPAINFFLAKEKIEESLVFKFIQKMPKGGALHLHDTALASADFVLYNITYRDHLLVCQNENGMQLVFADPPPQDECWIPLKNLREAANNTEEFDQLLRQKITLTTDDPYGKYPDINTVWQAFSNIFALQTPMISYRPVFEDYFYESLTEFYNDNVNYVEVRGTLPLVHELNGWPLNPVQVLALLKDVSDRFMKSHPDFLGIRYIYAPSRNVDNEVMSEYLQIYKMMKSLFPDFLVGFDLVGQEDLGQPLQSFVNQLLEADDTKFFFHAGETNWNGMSTDLNLVDAILLNTTRIGHGFGILKHPTVMELAKQRGVAIELCPISHQVLGLIKDLRNHPASYLFTQDFPLVISSDDPGLWDASPLSHDLYEAFMGIASSQADLKTLKQLALNSFIYSSLSPSEQKVAIERWTEKWNTFIKNILENGL